MDAKAVKILLPGTQKEVWNLMKLQKKKFMNRWKNLMCLALPFQEETLYIREIVWKSLLLQKNLREKYPKKTIWLYTGYLWEELQDLEILSYVDVLVDGKFILEQRDVSLKWKGSANQRVIDVKQSLETGSVVLHD